MTSTAKLQEAFPYSLWTAAKDGGVSGTLRDGTGVDVGPDGSITFSWPDGELHLSATQALQLVRVSVALGLARPRDADVDAPTVRLRGASGALPVSSNGTPHPVYRLGDAVKPHLLDLERWAIRWALDATGDSVPAAARKLGMPAGTLKHRILRFGLAKRRRSRWTKTQSVLAARVALLLSDPDPTCAIPPEALEALAAHRGNVDAAERALGWRPNRLTGMVARLAGHG